MVIIHWIRLLGDLEINLSCVQLSLQMYYRLKKSWWLSAESVADILHLAQVKTRRSLVLMLHGVL